MKAGRIVRAALNLILLSIYQQLDVLTVAAVRIGFEKNS
jgi:hypothetical protein